MLILKESVVNSLFANLDQAGVQEYQKTLLAALSEYENNPSIIPPRIVTTTKYCTHLFMASTGSRVGMKAITGSKVGFKGITTILDKETGYPIGIVNGATLTAFRTALCNTLPLIKFYPLNESYSNDKLIVFGVGDQAIWHIRLSLILYPNRFTNVIIVNRTISKAQNLCESFSKEYPNVNFKASGLSTGADNDDSLLEEFKDASVVFTCIPTSVPTVTKKLIERCKGRCFIGAIGSYKPLMTEIEGSVLKDLVIDKGTKIIVDSIEHCLHEAGEFIINDIKEESLIDISSLYSSDSNYKWIKESKVVVSKLVGLCIMDVWVGNHCLEEAEKLRVGITIDDF
jgi:ornithine cyclodeaminase/alanine dehydrogenase-like protein (mu-crystallin family)